LSGGQVLWRLRSSLRARLRHGAQSPLPILAIPGTWARAFTSLRHVGEAVYVLNFFFQLFGVSLRAIGFSLRAVGSAPEAEPEAVFPLFSSRLIAPTLDRASVKRNFYRGYLSFLSIALRRGRHCEDFRGNPRLGRTARQARPALPDPNPQSRPQV